MFLSTLNDSVEINSVGFYSSLSIYFYLLQGKGII